MYTNSNHDCQYCLSTPLEGQMTSLTRLLSWVGMGGVCWSLFTHSLRLAYLWKQSAELWAIECRVITSHWSQVAKHVEFPQQQLTPAQLWYVNETDPD